MTTYRETFVTLPVITDGEREELTLPAHKIQVIRGGGTQARITYLDGDVTARAVVALPAGEVRALVLSAMQDWQ